MAEVSYDFVFKKSEEEITKGWEKLPSDKIAPEAIDEGVIPVAGRTTTTNQDLTEAGRRDGGPGATHSLGAITGIGTLGGLFGAALRPQGIG